MRLLALASALAATTSLSWSQGTLWVDPALGADSGPGSEVQPFRTITWALSQSSPGGEVRLFPGTYGEASGEVMPLTLQSGVDIVSVGGRDVTEITSDSSGSCVLHRGSTLSGVLLRFNAELNLATYLAGTDARPAIIDCDLVGGSAGLSVAGLDFVDCRFTDQPQVVISRYQSDVRMTDCELIGGPLTSVMHHQYFYYDHPTLSVELRRCTLTGFGAGAINVFATSGASNLSFLFEDCLIVNNPGGGVDLRSAAGIGSASLYVDGCTIAGNGDYGLRGSLRFNAATELRSSIVSGHGISDAESVTMAEHSLVEDGAAPAGLGNLAGNPGFVNPAQGDFRLRADSVCLDAGSPGLLRLDHDRRPRAVDGDLDLLPRQDMGALEHQTLVGPKEAVWGQSIMLGVTGPAGGFSTIIVSPLGYAAVGATTPFGRLFLRSQGAFRLTPVLTTGAGPAMVDVALAMDPAWVGTSVGFQALPRSMNAPAGGAYSNPLLLSLRL